MAIKPSHCSHPDLGTLREAGRTQDSPPPTIQQSAAAATPMVRLEGDKQDEKQRIKPQVEQALTKE